MNADALYRHLFYGRDRAITIGDLAEQLNVPRRLVERAAEELRATGAPLCSGGEGLWLTDSGDELLEQYRALRKRAVTQLVNARPLLRTARRYAKNRQMTMWEDGIHPTPRTIEAPGWTPPWNEERVLEMDPETRGEAA